MPTTATATRTADSAVEPEVAAAITAADRIRQHANAGTYGPGHDYQVPGRVYGDAHNLLSTLLAVAYGADATRIYDAMIDSGIDHTEAAAHIVREKAAEVTVDAFDLEPGMRVEDDFTAYAEVLRVAKHQTNDAQVHVQWALGDGTTETTCYRRDDQFTLIPA